MKACGLLSSLFLGCTLVVSSGVQWCLLLYELITSTYHLLPLNQLSLDIRTFVPTLRLHRFLEVFFPKCYRGFHIHVQLPLTRFLGDASWNIFFQKPFGLFPSMTQVLTKIPSPKKQLKKPQKHLGICHSILLQVSGKFSGIRSLMATSSVHSCLPLELFCMVNVISSW